MVPPKKARPKKGGSKKKKKDEIALPKQIGVWVWAQCDNAGCQKWRKLPPGTVVNDNEPWFCYMNPNEDQNDCNIPEEEYNITTEAAVYSQPPSQYVSEDSDGDDKSSWHSQDESRGKRPRRSSNLGQSHSGVHSRQNRHFQDRNLSTSFDNANLTHQALRLSQGFGALPDKFGPNGEEMLQNEDNDDDGAMWREISQTKAKTKKAHAGYNKLLSLGGVWEVPKSKGKALTTLPGFMWEGLAIHTPDSAKIACQATDICSATRYFELAQAPNGSSQSQEAIELAQLALTLSSALAVNHTSQIPGIDDSPAQKTQTSSLNMPHGSKEVISGGEQAQGMFQTNAAQFFLPNNVPQNALGNTGVQASMEMLSKDQALGDPEFGSLSLSSANMHPLKTPQDSTQNALTHSQTSNANFTVAQPSGGKSFEQIQTGVFTPQGNQFSSLDSNLPSTSLNHSLDQNFPQAQNLPISQPFGSMGDVNWQGNRDKPPENKLRPGESKNDQSLMHLESLSNFPGFPGLATNEFSGLDMNLSPGQFSLGEQGLSNQFLGSDHNFFQQLPPVQDKNQE